MSAWGGRQTTHTPRQVCFELTHTLPRILSPSRKHWDSLQIPEKPRGWEDKDRDAEGARSPVKDAPGVMEEWRRRNYKEQGTLTWGRRREMCLSESSAGSSFDSCPISEESQLQLNMEDATAILKMSDSFTHTDSSCILHETSHQKA